MYFGFSAPALRLKFTFFQYLFPPWSPFFSFPSPTRAHVGVSARIGLAALWLAKTWNFLKKYLNCFFCFVCIWSFSYPPIPLLLPGATWRMLWQIWGPHPSHFALRGPCYFPICRRHPRRLPLRHTGSQKTSVANL